MVKNRLNEVQDHPIMAWLASKSELIRSIAIRTAFCLCLLVFCLYTFQGVLFDTGHGLIERKVDDNDFSSSDGGIDELFNDKKNELTDVDEDRDQHQALLSDDEIDPSVELGQMDQDDHGRDAHRDKEQVPVGKKTKVWITMGLCWGENARIYGKEHFPYAEAALRSIALWHKLTKAQVVLQIVFRQDKFNIRMGKYSLNDFRSRVEKLGAKVILLPLSEDSIGCVLASQLTRLLVSHTQPFIGDDDIIVTSDVDAFVMSEDILLPLKLKEKLVWIWRYEQSFTTGCTFMLSFIGAYSKVWKSILRYNEGDSLESMVAAYKHLLNFNSSDEWDLDQRIVTRSLIESKLCSVQKDNKLWKEMNLEPREFSDDYCWHGSSVWEDCNNKLWQRNAYIKYYGSKCRWWHFYPDETVKDLQQKYSEIMSGKANSGVFDSLIRGASKLTSGLPSANYVTQLASGLTSSNYVNDLLQGAKLLKSNYLDKIMENSKRDHD